MKSRKKGLDRVLPWANMGALSVVIFASVVIQGVKAGRRKYAAIVEMTKTI